MKKINEILFHIMGKYSFKKMITIFFIVVALVPMIIIQLISYSYLKDSFQKNVDELANANVSKTRSNVVTVLEGYEDILYQIYTDDGIIENINNIDQDIDAASNMNELRLSIRTLCYVKDGIEAVSIITPEGNFIHYDKISASSVKSSWIDKATLTKDEIYELGMMDYKTHILPTHYAIDQANTPVYLFHFVHRMIDYRDTDNPVGVAILSLNENILDKLCQNSEIQNSYSYIINNDNYVISSSRKEVIGTRITEPDKRLPEDEYSSLTSVYVSENINDWNIVTVMEQNTFWGDLMGQMGSFILLGLAIMAVALFAMMWITSLISSSMNRVVSAMKLAQTGDLQVSVENTNLISSEMVSIVDTFNTMMVKIKELLETVKNATSRKKEAEIKALEAQINPHFLYNILDSINWMAIESNQFEMSHMVTSLAKILRYSINNSNAMVPLRDELEWMRQYIYLQSIRFKNSFEYILDIKEEELLEFRVHKLLLQPFIENALIHGFKDSKRRNLLNVLVERNSHGMCIMIRDNGRGISPEVLKAVLDNKEHLGDHIGMRNAVDRFKMYYGDESKVTIESTVGIGTTISILLPFEEV